MSRKYEMSVLIKNLKSGEKNKAEMALEEEWNWESFEERDETCLWMVGTSYLGGGETEKEFFHRCCQRVWKELGRYVEVEITATYLEELPYETYISDEDDFVDIGTALEEE